MDIEATWKDLISGKDGEEAPHGAFPPRAAREATLRVAARIGEGLKVFDPYADVGKLVGCCSSMAIHKYVGVGAYKEDMGQIRAAREFIMSMGRSPPRIDLFEWRASEAMILLGGGFDLVMVNARAEEGILRRCGGILAPDGVVFFHSPGTMPDTSRAYLEDDCVEDGTLSSPAEGLTAFVKSTDLRAPAIMI